MLSIFQLGKGEKMKNKISILCFILSMLPNFSYADVFDLELNVSQSALEGRVETHFLVSDMMLTTGLDIVSSSSEEDYTIGGLAVSLGGNTLTSDLQLDIGFRGIFGKVDKKREDGNVMALAFLIALIYDIPEIGIYNRIPLDFEVRTEVNTAPEPLSFGDSNNYLEINTSLGLHVLGNKRGTLLVGYRNILSEFKNDERDDWELSDASWFVGYRFRF